MDAQFRIVFGQDKMNQLDERSGKLDPRRPPADNDKRHQRPLPGRIGLVDRPLEGGEYVVAQCLPVRQLLEVERVPLDRL